MKTVNSLSGGKTSSYIAANYKADYDVFALVRTSDKSCMFPDKKLRQIVSDKIGKEFIGTLEDDIIIYTMLDLEQYIGREIFWISGMTFDELLNKKKTLPNVSRRFCTQKLKVDVIADWWLANVTETIEMRIGFRANETHRAKKLLDKTNDQGFTEQKIRIEINENGYDKWKMFSWRKPTFPLIEDGIYKDNIESYWKDKGVRFAPINNCVGCFSQNAALARKRFEWHPSKMDWFLSKERVFHDRSLWRNGYDEISLEEIKKWNPQIDMFSGDFDECDSGYCGI